MKKTNFLMTVSLTLIIKVFIINSVIAVLSVCERAVSITLVAQYFVTSVNFEYTRIDILVLIFLNADF